MKMTDDEIAKIAEEKFGILASELCIVTQGDRLWVQRGLDASQKHELKGVELDIPAPTWSTRFEFSRARSATDNR